LITASGSYTHAEFKSIAGPFQGAAAVQPGDAVPDVPRQKFNVGGEYTHSVVGGTTGYLHLDWNHLGAVPTGFTYHDTRPAYGSLEASVGVRTEHYDVSLYGHNLTNSNGILQIQEGATTSYGSVFNTRISTPPRVMGIDFKLRY
jgi:hypothetical protein